MDRVFLALFVTVALVLIKSDSRFVRLDYSVFGIKTYANVNLYENIYLRIDIDNVRDVRLRQSIYTHFKFSGLFG